jgi:hypothetical protein
MDSQRLQTRLPARVAVRLDLRQIGQCRPDMADRGQLVETVGTVGAKPLVGEAGAAAGVVDVDVGAHHQDQRAGSVAGGLFRDYGLCEHLPQRRLAGRIAGLVAAGEVEEQLHEFGRRGIADVGLRRSRRCGNEQ